MSRYEDIIGITHFEPKHPRMSMDARGAQFAPYAALTGYEDEIDEANRSTLEKFQLDEELSRELNEQIKVIEKNIDKHPKVEITYFIKDSKKSGGDYLTIIDNIKRIDYVNRIIYLMDKTKIKIDDILNINI